MTDIAIADYRDFQDITGQHICQSCDTAFDSTEKFYNCFNMEVCGWCKVEIEENI
jgi:hypothetical protein